MPPQRRETWKATWGNEDESNSLPIKQCLPLPSLPSTSPLSQN